MRKLFGLFVLPLVLSAAAPVAVASDAVGGWPPSRPAIIRPGSLVPARWQRSASPIVVDISRKAPARRVNLIIVPMYSTARQKTDAVTSGRSNGKQVAAWWHLQTPNLTVRVVMRPAVKATSRVACSYGSAWKKIAPDLAGGSGGLPGVTRDHIVAYAPWCETNPAGVGQLGGPLIWVASPNPPVLAHEFGHNLGYSHSNSYDCRTRSKARTPLSRTCAEEEYADVDDVMGTSGGDLVDRRLSGRFRYLAGAKTVAVRTGGSAHVILQAPGHQGTAVLQAPATGGPVWFDRGTEGGLDAHVGSPLGQALLTNLGSHGRLLLGDSWTPPGAHHTLVVAGSTATATSVWLSPPGLDQTNPSAVAITPPAGLTDAPFALDWEAATDASGIAAYLIDVGGHLLRVPGDQTEVTMPGLTQDTTVTVTAVDGAGRRSSGSAMAIALTTPQADLIIGTPRDEFGRYYSPGPFTVSVNYHPGPPPPARHYQLEVFGCAAGQVDITMDNGPVTIDPATTLSCTEDYGLYLKLQVLAGETWKTVTHEEVSYIPSGLARIASG